MVKAKMAAGSLVFPSGYAVKLADWAHIGDQSVQVSVRPEEFIILAAGGDGIQGVISDSIYLGQNTHYMVDLSSGERVELIRESAINDTLVKGVPVSLGIKAEKINIFSEDGASNLVRRDSL